MLVAALAGTADLAEVSQAIAAAGGSLTDLAAAERAGLLRVTPAGVSFCHPLARAAILAGSDVAERAAGHRALAGVLDGDRRAWHRAALADGPHEQVAAELDAAAQRAGLRGSRAAMSAAYERAAALSASPAAKRRRLALAAEAAADAGQLPRAADLARQAGQLTGNQVQAARLARVQAQLQFDAGRPADAASFLLDGALRRRAATYRAKLVPVFRRTGARSSHASAEVETLRCTACGREFKRARVRGRNPMHCPACASARGEGTSERRPA